MNCPVDEQPHRRTFFRWMTGALSSLAATVLTHLDKYWEHLVPEASVGASWPRTTNQLESTWGDRKRNRRQAHGRGKLTRDFQSLPAEYLLVANLENPLYVQLVLGGRLESLATQLAEASLDGPNLTHWRTAHRPRLIGQLRRRQLRSQTLLPDLIEISTEQCRPTDVNAA